jgi:hypothetical protein
MSIRVDTTLGTFKAEGAKKSEPMPKKAMEAARDAVLDEIQKEIDGLEKQLNGMKANDPSRSYVEEQLEKAQGKLGHDVTRISGEKGRTLLLKAEDRGFYDADAGHAKAACKNATLWSIGFGYETHAPMAGFLTDVPKDKKVVFNVICSPSAHADFGDGAEANFEKFALENEYEAGVYYVAPGKQEWERELVTSVKFKVNGKSPEYASMSPDMTVDLSKFKGGKLMVEGYAIGSAGVEGYVEARRTVIDL